MTRVNENFHLHQAGKHRCTICGTVYPLTSRYLYIRPDGSISSRCRACDAAYQQKRQGVERKPRAPKYTLSYWDKKRREHFARVLREIGAWHGE